MMKTYLITAVVLIALSLTAANATLQTVVLATQQTPATPANLIWGPNALSFLQYNSSSYGGHPLLSVKIDLEGRLETGFVQVVNNNAGSAHTTTMETTGEVDAYGPFTTGSVLVSASPLIAKNNFNTAGNTTDTENVLAPITQTQSVTLTTGGDFNAFIGGGNVSFNLMGAGSGGGFGDSGQVYSGDGTSDGRVTITYTYDDGGSGGGTPELGTFALFGMSMLPIAGVAIRRRKRA
jgi:hypothetical protein